MINYKNEVNYSEEDRKLRDEVAWQILRTDSLVDLTLAPEEEVAKRVIENSFNWADLYMKERHRRKEK